MGASFELGAVEAATAGTIGVPGQRVFYLQFRTRTEVVTLRLEKQQVGALAEYLGELLADLPSPEDVPDPATLELEEPVDPAWVVGSMGLASDAEHDIVKSYQLGANCYVTKPVGLVAFQSIVQAIEGFWFTVVKLP